MNNPTFKQNVEKFKKQTVKKLDIVLRGKQVQALDLIPADNTIDDVVLIDKKVLTKIVKSLSNAPLRTIKDDFKECIDNVHTLEEYVSTLKEEHDFHSTMHLIHMELLKPDTSSINVGKIDLNI